MTETNNCISNELWQDINALDEHDLSAFDDCFGQDDEFFDMVIDSNVHENSMNEPNANKKRLLEFEQYSSKKTRSCHLKTLQDNPCDASVVSELNTDASVQSAQLAFLTPMELDQQLDQSMSRLTSSMKRSELSRQRVISNPSGMIPNPFGLSVLLGNTSAKATRHGTNALVKSGRSHLRSYINHMGSNL